MSSTGRIQELLEADVWFDLDPRYWSRRQHAIDSVPEFCLLSPCLEWTVYVVATYNIEYALAILRVLLLDTWSRLECARPLVTELGERVQVLQLPNSLTVATMYGDPPLTETWILVGEENLGAEYELALCIGALARFHMESTEDLDPNQERAIGILVGLRRIWSELVPAPLGWDPNYLAPEDRKIDSDTAYADSVLLRRYQGLIGRLCAKEP